MSAADEVPTKLIVAVVPDHLAGAVLDALIAAGCRVTRIASTGGFLRGGSTTFLAGVEAARVEPALSALRVACQAGEKPSDVGRVTLFVFDVARFERL